MGWTEYICAVVFAGELIFHGGMEQIRFVNIPATKLSP